MRGSEEGKGRCRGSSLVFKGKRSRGEERPAANWPSMAGEAPAVTVSTRNQREL
jgi:hypothetical protein